MCAAIAAQEGNDERGTPYNKRGREKLLDAPRDRPQADLDRASDCKEKL